MLNFREEMSKYKPALVVSDIEKSVNNDDIKDIMDLMENFTKQLSQAKAANVNREPKE